MAIRHLDVQRRVNITSYLATHVHDTTRPLTVNGLGLGVSPKKLGGFTGALEEAMDKVLGREKVKVENKAPKGAKGDQLASRIPGANFWLHGGSYWR